MDINNNLYLDLCSTVPLFPYTQRWNQAFYHPNIFSRKPIFSTKCKQVYPLTHSISGPYLQSYVYLPRRILMY